MKDFLKAIPVQVQIIIATAVVGLLGAISEAVLTYVDSLNPGV